MSVLRRFRYTAPRCVGTMLAVPFSQRQRDTLKAIAKIYGYGRVRGDLPVVALQELVPEPPPITLHELARGRWSITDFELIVINQLAVRRQPRRVFEFGTFDGRTTLNLAANTPDSTEIVTMDLPPGTKPLPGAVVGERFADSPLRSRITQVFGNSLQHDFSAYHNSVDFIFIDAGHSYENVMNDQSRALEMLRDRRGAILWHDYESFAGVTRAVDEFARAHPSLGRYCRIDGTFIACCLAG